MTILGTPPSLRWQECALAADWVQEYWTLVQPFILFQKGVHCVWRDVSLLIRQGGGGQLVTIDHCAIRFLKASFQNPLKLKLVEYLQISILVKQGVHKYRIQVAKQKHSPCMDNDGWHPCVMYVFHSNTRCGWTDHHWCPNKADLLTEERDCFCLRKEGKEGNVHLVWDPRMLHSSDCTLALTMRGTSTCIQVTLLCSLGHDLSTEGSAVRLPGNSDPRADEEHGPVRRLGDQRIHQGKGHTLHQLALTEGLHRPLLGNLPYCYTLIAILVRLSSGLRNRWRNSDWDFVLTQQWWAGGDQEGLHGV